MSSMIASQRLQAKAAARCGETERRAGADQPGENKQHQRRRTAVSPPPRPPAATGGGSNKRPKKSDVPKARSPAKSVANPRVQGPNRPCSRKHVGGRGSATKQGQSKQSTQQHDKKKTQKQQQIKKRKAASPPKGNKGTGSQRKGSKGGKRPKSEAKGKCNRGASAAAFVLPAGFRKMLGKGPGAKQRKLFKLKKSLVPLGIWPAWGDGEAFDLAPEWKASLLKRYENPPPYKKLKANLYPESSLRGLVPVDEIPLCHCSVEDGCNANCINRLLQMECVPGRCPTLREGSTHCQNNAIQTKTFPSTEIFRTFEGRGWGLRLCDEKGAVAGTILHEYLGEVIMMDECRKRLRKVGRKGVGGSSSDFYFASLDGNLVLDAGPMGSEARFANHSCAPNCLLQKWSVLGETRVVLVAARNLSVGEELTYNYQADTLGGFVERQKCLCGERQCSGFIGGELVAVKEQEWQRRASKVMSQAKPQLDVVRELVYEGQELGYQVAAEGEGEEAREDGDMGSCSAVRYRGREMECLSIMLKEGDSWLERLAEVLEGRAESAVAAANASVYVEEKAPVADTSRRTSSRASRGSWKRIRAYDDADAGAGADTDNKEEEEPRVVDLVQLEKVLEVAPAGLQVHEAVKAKKTVARAGQAAQTVWALLDAAARHGLEGVKVPAARRIVQQEAAAACAAGAGVASAAAGGVARDTPVGSNPPDGMEEEEKEGPIALPPKPRMTQVYQAIRTCRGLAPVFIPGASELEKLVASAEAWAQEACDMLKIKTDADKDASNNAKNGPRKNIGGGSVADNGTGETGTSKWAKLGLEGSAMTALEEKLKEVAEFSLAREQREEEAAKERLLKEKQDRKERDRQARLEKAARRQQARWRKGLPQTAEGRREGGQGGFNNGSDNCNATESGAGAAPTDGSANESVEGSLDGSFGGFSARAWEARRSPRLGSGPGGGGGGGSGKGGGGALAGAEGEGQDETGGWTKKDEMDLHCLCRLPADTARFRTLMTCDLCSRWFHPACVRLKELPERERNGQALAFVCPMCEHCRGGVSNFACPPSLGFYIGRRIHRPGLSELETLIKHADSLPVDGVEGQDYLSYMVEQVAGWRDRCDTVAEEVQAYIRNGAMTVKGGGTAAAAAIPERPGVARPRESPTHLWGEEQGDSAAAIAPGEEENEAAGGGKGGAHRGTVGEVGGVGRGVPSPPDLVPRSSTGLVLGSVGRDLAFEAGLVERLGRLVCEGALIEVVDVHKEDTLLRRGLWVLTASMAFPSTAACLRAGQGPGLAEVLSIKDQETLRSSGLCQDSTPRLRPTFETLEASLTEGRTLGLTRNRSKDKSKSRRISPSAIGSVGGAGPQHAGGGSEDQAVSAGSSGPSALAVAPSGSASADERPSTDPLGAGVRMYACLFDAVGEVIQAVVKSEAKPFSEAKSFLPALRTATRWADIEQSWGYARALASELSWSRSNRTPAPSPAVGEATSTGGGAAAASDEHDATDVHCICRGADYGSVMVECDACLEWFHASCVGLTDLKAEGLQQYYCMACCELHAEKYGHYKHRWTTNVAVEAAVRRITRRKTSNANKQMSIASEAAVGMARATNDCSVEGGGGADDGEAVYGSAGSPRLEEAVVGQPVAVVRTKRLRDKVSRRNDPPGAKRARAAASVTAYVKGHYEGLGIPWMVPPQQPLPPGGAEGNGQEPCGQRSGDAPVVGETGSHLRQSSVTHSLKEGSTGALREQKEAIADESSESTRTPLLMEMRTGRLVAGHAGTGMVGGGCGGSGAQHGGHCRVYLHEHQHQHLQQQQERQQQPQQKQQQWSYQPQQQVQQEQEQQEQRHQQGYQTQQHGQRQWQQQPQQPQQPQQQQRLQWGSQTQEHGYLQYEQNGFSNRCAQLQPLSPQPAAGGPYPIASAGSSLRSPRLAQLHPTFPAANSVQASQTTVEAANGTQNRPVDGSQALKSSGASTIVVAATMAWTSQADAEGGAAAAPAGFQNETSCAEAGWAP